MYSVVPVASLSSGDGCNMFFRTPWTGTASLIKEPEYECAEFPHRCFKTWENCCNIKT